MRSIATMELLEQVNEILQESERSFASIIVHGVPREAFDELESDIPAMQQNLCTNPLCVAHRAWVKRRWEPDALSLMFICVEPPEVTA